MLEIFKSKIDKLVSKNEQLVLQKTKIRDTQNSVNANLERKMNNLEKLAFRNKDKADSQIANIDRQIEKNKKLINIEVDYAKELGLKLKGDK